MGLLSTRGSTFERRNRLRELTAEDGCAVRLWENGSSVRAGGTTSSPGRWLCDISDLTRKVHFGPMVASAVPALAKGDVVFG